MLLEESDKPYNGDKPKARIMVTVGSALDLAVKTGMISSEGIEFFTGQPREERIMNDTKQFVQGDLMFIPIENADPLNKLQPVDGQYIIARGEKTGHQHVIEAERANLFDNGILVVDVDDTPITHDEHPPLSLTAGAYRVVRQETFDLREAVAKRPKTRVVWD